jgi:LicD family
MKRRNDSVRVAQQILICFFLVILGFRFYLGASQIEDLENLPISHFLFGGYGRAEAHTISSYFNPSILQKDRLESLRGIIKRIPPIFEKIGLLIILDSGSLLGYYRDKDVIPWDCDVDFSFIQEECLSLEVKTGKKIHELVNAELPEGFELSGFNCEHPEHFVMGRINDKQTGFFADFFAREKIQDSKGIIRYPRVNDFMVSGRHAVPEEILFPVKNVTWFETPIFVPNKSESFLVSEFGNLSIPLFPIKFFLIYQVSAISMIVASLPTLIRTKIDYESGLVFLGMLWFRKGFAFMWICALLICAIIKVRDNRVLDDSRKYFSFKEIALLASAIKIEIIRMIFI